MRRTTGVALVLLAAGTLGGCATADAGARDAAAGDPRAGSTALVEPSPGPATPAPEAATLCAELPSDGALAGDLEGWWNATPADADGDVLTDPADWASELREHPRVATVDVDSGTVLSLYDRVACTQDPAGYVPPAPTPAWAPGATVVLDADTGEVLAVHAG